MEFCKIQFIRSFDRSKHNIISALTQTQAWASAKSLADILRILSKNSDSRVESSSSGRSVSNNNHNTQSEAMDTSNINSEIPSDVNHISNLRPRQNSNTRGRGSHRGRGAHRGRERSRAPHKNCPSCSRKVPAWCKFCGTCGNRFQNVSEPYPNNNTEHAGSGNPARNLSNIDSSAQPNFSFTQGNSSISTVGKYGILDKNFEPSKSGRVVRHNW